MQIPVLKLHCLLCYRQCQHTLRKKALWDTSWAGCPAFPTSCLSHADVAIASKNLQDVGSDAAAAVATGYDTALEAWAAFQRCLQKRELKPLQALTDMISEY